MERLAENGTEVFPCVRRRLVKIEPCSVLASGRWRDGKQRVDALIVDTAVEIGAGPLVGHLRQPWHHECWNPAGLVAEVWKAPHLDQFCFARGIWPISTTCTGRLAICVGHERETTSKGLRAVAPDGGAKPRSAGRGYRRCAHRRGWWRWWCRRG